MRRDFRLCAWLYGFAPGLLLALLFLFPQAAMQGVKDGLLLWTQAVLPALLPFFVVTSLLQSSGALDLLSPLAAPLCRLFRLPKRAGGILLAGWLSGAPNGARLASALCAEGSLPPDACARLTAVCTVTGPLFLVGAVGGWLGSPARGALLFAVQLLGAVLNGLLWRNHGAVTDEPQEQPSFSPESSLRALPEALRQSSLSLLFIGAAIALFSSLAAVLDAVGIIGALERVLLWAIPKDAVRPLLSGFLEVSGGCRQMAQAALSLPLRLSLICALTSFGGISVLCQSQVFLKSSVRPAIYFCQRLTHTALSFALCRAFCLLPVRTLPVFAPTGAPEIALPALWPLLCLLPALLPAPRNRKGR